MYILYIHIIVKTKKSNESNYIPICSLRKTKFDFPQSRTNEKRTSRNPCLMDPPHDENEQHQKPPSSDDVIDEPKNSTNFSKGKGPMLVEKDVPIVLQGWVNTMLRDQFEENEHNVLCYLMGMDLNTILVLESKCPLLVTAMREQHWWELLYVKWFPITYERLQHAPLSSNAKQSSSSHSSETPSHHLYRDIWVAQHAWTISTSKPKQELNSKEANKEANRFSAVPKGACVATALADEFGLGPLFATSSPIVYIATREDNSKETKDTQWVWSNYPLRIPELNTQSNNEIVDGNTRKRFDATAIPLQGKVILRLHQEEQEGSDLVMLNIGTNPITSRPYILPQDMSNWAINYPDGDALHLPAFLEGDASLEIPSIAATEKNAHLSSLQQNGVLSVVLDRVWPPPYDTLVFDQLYQKQSPTHGAKGHTNNTWKTWHELCTARVKLDHVVTSTAYVLDSFLLLASSDGTLWAKPRNNPRSQYFVAQFPAPITFLTSLYNVIAFMCNGNSTLQVCHIKRISVDPFISLVTAYSISSNVPDTIDSEYSEAKRQNTICPVQPLLFGPFLLYQSAYMEQSWKEEHIIDDARSKQMAQQENEKASILAASTLEEKTKSNPDGVPPVIYKGTRNWARNRKIAIARYGPWESEIRDAKRKEDYAKAKKERDQMKKEAESKMIKKRGAEFVLVNYETKVQSKVNFPAHLFPYGWRLYSIKMANHSHWVLTLYNHKMLKDVVFQIP
jgi:hypothetical protein